MSYFFNQLNSQSGVMGDLLRLPLFIIMHTLIFLHTLTFQVSNKGLLMHKFFSTIFSWNKLSEISVF